MNIAVAAVAAGLHADAVGERDALGRLDIFRDGASGNDHVAFFLHDRSRLHTFENTAAHLPEGGVGADFNGAVQLLRRGGIVHDQKDRVSFLDGEPAVEGALHDLEKLALEEFNRRGNVRKSEHMGNHVRAGFQALKGNNQGR